MEELLSKYFPIKQKNVLSDVENSSVVKAQRLRRDDSNFEDGASQQQTVAIRNTSVVLEVENFHEDDGLNSWQLLKQEFDTIHKWKVATEIHIQQKEKLLDELTQMSENQRKVVSELQLENGNLSYKLQDEFKNREEALEKFYNLFPLMETLKKHFDYLAKRINKFEKLEAHLSQNSAYFESQIDEIKNKLVERDTKYKNDCEELKKQLEDEMRRSNASESKLKQRLESYEEQISMLKLEVDTKLKDIGDLRATNQTLNLKFVDKMGELSDLNTKFEAVTATVATLESQLKAESDRLNVETTNGDKLKKENHELDEKLEILKKEKDDVFKEKAELSDIYEDIKKREENTTKIRMSLEEENRKTLQELETKANDLKAMEEKLRIVQEKNKVLMKEKLAFDETIENLEKSNAELKVTVNKLQSENWNNSSKMQLQSDKYLAIIAKLDKQIVDLKGAAETSKKERDGFISKIAELSAEKLELASKVTANKKIEETNTAQEKKRTYERKRRVTFSPVVSTKEPEGSTSPLPADNVFDQLLKSSPQIPSTSKKSRSCRTNKTGEKCYGRSRTDSGLKNSEAGKAKSVGNSGDVYDDVYDIFNYVEED